MRTLMMMSEALQLQKTDHYHQSASISSEGNVILDYQDRKMENNAGLLTHKYADLSNILATPQEVAGTEAVHCGTHRCATIQ